MKNMITVEFEVDPYQGFAALAVKMRKPGYTFVCMKRIGTKAVVTFQKDKRDAAKPTTD